MKKKQKAKNKKIKIKKLFAKVEEICSIISLVWIMWIVERFCGVSAEFIY